MGFNHYNTNFTKITQIYRTDSIFFQETKSLLDDQPIKSLLFGAGLVSAIAMFKYLID